MHTTTAGNGRFLRVGLAVLTIDGTNRREVATKGTFLAVVSNCRPCCRAPAGSGGNRMERRR